MSIQIQLNRLLNNLPDLFYKSVGSNVYNFFLTIANEFYLTEEALSDIKDQINIVTSSGDSLDLHAQSFALFRSLGESDTSFRARILASFIRPQITKPRLIEAVEDLSTTTPIIEEYFIDRWWIGGNPTISTVTELLSANGDIFTTSQSISVSSYPDIYPFYDVLKTGTNYGSGSMINDSTITTTIELPVTGSDFLYQVTYTPLIADTTPVSSYDHVPESFINDNTILRTNNVHNNVGIRWLGESVESGTTIASSANIYEQGVFGISTITGQTSGGYGVDVSWWDEDNNQIYKWRTYTDKYGIIRFNDSKRIDSEIGSERRFTDTIAGTSVDVAFNVANVVGVFDGSDSSQVGTNYFISLVTETVTSTNREYIEVSNNIDSIQSIYLNNPINYDANFWEQGKEIGNFFIDNKIYLAYPLTYNQASVQVTYYKKGSVISNNKIVLSQSTSTGKEVIVRYRKNPISNYNNVTFEDLLYAGHDDNKFTFELQIQQDILKWGDGKKYGEGYKWGQFYNPNTQTIGEIIDTSKAAGTKALITVRNPTSIYGDPLSIYGEIFYETTYY